MDRALTSLVKAAAARAGFPRCGICRLADIPGRLPSRAAAQLPEKGSIAVLLLPYYTGLYPRRNVALYCIPDDYHTIAAEMLDKMTGELRRRCPAQLWLGFADSSPIPEKSAAAAAGLGCIGRNTLLITPEYGSLCFIAEIVTDADLVPDAPLSESLCTGCGECVRRCPTGAISPQGVDREGCLSAISQRKGELTPAQRQALADGGLIWGCDCCLLACPANAHPAITPVQRFAEDLLPTVTSQNLTANISRKSWGWRGEAVIRRNLDIMAKEAESRG